MFKLYADLIAFHLRASEDLASSELIRRSDAFTKSVLAASPDGVMVLSVDGRVEYINERGVSLNEFDGARAVVGRSYVDLWPADEQPKVRAALDRSRTQEVVRIEAFGATATGRPAWWEVGITSFTTDDGDEKIVCISRDVGARVEAETAKAAIASRLAELNETLEQRIADRSAALARSEEALRQSLKMEAVGQLTGGLAHDFNNLLTGISGNFELLARRMAQGSTADLGKYVVSAQSASRRAAALTHRLLAFARRQTLAPTPTDVDRLIVGMEELIHRSIGPAVTLDVVGSDERWLATVDGNQLENALLNLCLNARDAMPNGGRITIETANRRVDAVEAHDQGVPAGDYVCICVRDTGTGMTPDVVAHAFDPFFTTKPIGMGTGLGLSMVYGFARQSGGFIRIHSTVGHGTALMIDLPRHDGDVVAAAPEWVAPDVVPSVRHETVLVVDDEPEVRALVMEVLDEFGYVGIEAGDGAAALAAVRSGRAIDLLLTDVGLPGPINGRQVADAARQLRPGLPVLFITGYADSAVIGEAHLEPGMEVLTKPFAVQVLARRVQALIARR